MNETILPDLTDDSLNNSSLDFDVEFPINEYNVFTFAITNSRSLPGKINSVLVAFEGLNLDFMIVSETWLQYRKSHAEDLKKLEEGYNIGHCKKNRKTRGGGVAILYKNTKLSLKQCYPFPADIEITCAIGKTLHDNRKVLILAVYIPPKTSAAQFDRIGDCISERIGRAKNEHDDPYIVIGGDFNRRELAGKIANYPDIIKQDVGNTRGLAQLDCCYSNLAEGIRQVKTCRPLMDERGNESDHSIVMVRHAAKKVHHFKKTINFQRSYTEAGAEKFGTMLEEMDWEFLRHLTLDGMVEEFQATVENMCDDCFVMKRHVKKSTDKPWFTRRIGNVLRKRDRIYLREGKTDRWKEAAARAEETVLEGKERYVTGVKKQMLEEGNTNAYYRAIKVLGMEDSTTNWCASSMFPNLDDMEIAEKAAAFFSGISNEFEPLPKPPPPEEIGITIPSTTDICQALKKMKIPKSRVKGDLDPRLVTKFPRQLSTPLQIIFEKALTTNDWPTLWKTETVHVIPKKKTPETLADLRNLSCTPLFSKLLETFLHKELKETIQLSRNQYGGKKGQGVDHLLIELWDKILRGLEDSEAAVNIMAIDFHKAFNKMNHKSCLQALEKLGARKHVVEMVAAFLSGRKMSVKINEYYSTPRGVNGGAPQGCILGCLLFCATVNDLLEIPEEIINDRSTTSESFHTANDSLSSIGSHTGGPDLDDVSSCSEEDIRFFRWKHDPLEDTVLSERMGGDELDVELGVPGGWRPSRTMITGYIDDFTVVEKNRKTNAITHITQAKTVRQVHAQECQSAFVWIADESKKKGMCINPTKTQLLCISADIDCNTESYLDIAGKRVRSEEEMKILGFWFDGRPSVHCHVEKLLDKARGRLWFLRKVKRSGLKSEDLLKTYLTMIRPILDYTAPTYHTQLSKQQANELEAFQAVAMKIVFGQTVSYRTVIENGRITTLHQRREELFKKFTMKARNNENFNYKWFPLNEDVNYELRARNVYLEEFPRTERMMKSPIFKMRKLLNSLE